MCLPLGNSRGQEQPPVDVEKLAPAETLERLGWSKLTPAERRSWGEFLAWFAKQQKVTSLPAAAPKKKAAVERGRVAGVVVSSVPGAILIAATEDGTRHLSGKRVLLEGLPQDLIVVDSTFISADCDLATLKPKRLGSETVYSVQCFSIGKY